MILASRMKTVLSSTALRALGETSAMAMAPVLMNQSAFVNLVMEELGVMSSRAMMRTATEEVHAIRPRVFARARTDGGGTRVRSRFAHRRA